MLIEPENPGLVGVGSLVAHCQPDLGPLGAVADELFQAGPAPLGIFGSAA